MICKYEDIVDIALYCVCTWERPSILLNIVAFMLYFIMHKETIVLVQRREVKLINLQAKAATLL